MKIDQFEKENAKLTEDLEVLVDFISGQLAEKLKEGEENGEIK